MVFEPRAGLGVIVGLDNEQLAKFCFLALEQKLLTFTENTLVDIGSVLNNPCDPANQRIELHFANPLLYKDLVFNFAKDRLEDEQLYKWSTDPAFALGATQESRSIEPLISALEKPNFIIRRAVAQSLRQFAKDSRVVTALIRSLNDPNANVRFHAIESLMFIDTDDAIEPLIGLLSDTEDVIEGMFAASQGTIAQMAARALKSLNNEKARVAVKQWRATEAKRLIRRLSDTDTDVRSRAALDLATWGDESAIEPLIQLLSDMALDRWSVPVCHRAAEALGNLKAEQAVDALIQMLPIKLNVEYGFGAGLEPSDAAREALTKIGSAKARQAVAKFTCGASSSKSSYSL